MSFLVLFIIAVCLLVFAVKVSRKNKEESAKYQSPEMPTHIDLLDDNGEPINSSDDRVRPSEAPHIRVVICSDDGKDAPVQELQYFCVKDKGYNVSVWPKNQDLQGIDYIEFNIAGITHGEHIDEHLGEFVATLVPDPTNPYDANAIKIMTDNGHRVGFVPRDTTVEIRDFTTLPCQCYCFIGNNNGTYFSVCYITKN
jgi:hypothetical protein